MEKTSLSIDNLFICHLVGVFVYRYMHKLKGNYMLIDLVKMQNNILE